MKKWLRIACLSFAVFILAGCGGEKQTYYSGKLTVGPDEVTFVDWANYATMDVSGGSAGKLAALPVSAGDSAAVYWVEFYGHVEYPAAEAPAGQRMKVHINSLISYDGSNRLSNEMALVGIYEAETDNKKQMIVLHPDYTYEWIIYPDKRYEIVTWGIWKRTGPLDVKMTPFGNQDMPEREGESDWEDMGAVDITEEGAIEIMPSHDSLPRPDDSQGAAGKPRKAGEREDMKQSRQAYIKMVDERKKTSAPGAAGFRFDTQSQTLIEADKGTIVFWKVYI